MYEKLPDDFSLICDLRSSQPKGMRMETLQWIKHSVISDQYKIFMNNVGQPVGYVIWANVIRESLLSIKRVGRYPMWLYEWQEGNITLILDILFMTDAVSIKNTLIPLLKSKRVIAYRRKNKGKLFIKKHNIFKRVNSNS